MADPIRDDGPREGVEHDPIALAVASRHQPRSAQLVVRSISKSVRLVVASDRRRALLSACLQLLGAALVAVQLLLGKLVIDAIVDGGGDTLPPEILGPLIGLALTSSATTTVAVLVTQQQRLLGEAVSREVSGSVLRVSSRVELAAYDDPRFHDLLQRVQTFALSRPIEVTQGVVTLGTGAFAASALLVVLATADPLLVPLLLAAAVPLLLLGRSNSRAEFAFAVEQTLTVRQRDYIDRVLSEKAQAKEVRAFQLGGLLLRRWQDLFDHYLHGLRRHIRRRTRVALLGAAVSTVALTSTLLLLYVLVRRGRIDVGEAAVTAFGLRLLAARLEMVVAGLGKLLEASLFLKDLERFLGLAQLALPDVVRRPPGASAVVRAEGLSFGYPGAPELALNDITLAIGAGEVHALVGENGSGKTTLSKVLAGLYEPSKGALVWEVDGREIPREEYATQATVLFQDFARYELSARENIALGRADIVVNDERVREAATAAGLAKLLDELPDGFDTVLSTAFPGGRDLSLGQWQRVALARAFYRDAPVVILDEPTASLDPRAEHQLFQDLRVLLAGRSVLLVSHRFSNVRLADRIHVMSGGAIVESGSHDELIELNGTYAELYLLQARAYGLEDEAAAHSS